MKCYSLAGNTPPTDNSVADLLVIVEELHFMLRRRYAEQHFGEIMTGYEHWRQVQPPCIDTWAQKDKIQTAEMELRRWVSSQTEFEK